jgi:TRAP-type uncharacterized transport system fused permease subunit
LVPFAFVIHPDGVGLLLKGSPGNAVYVTITASLGIAALACGVQGWMLQRTTWLERSMLIAAGLVFVYPAPAGDLVGLLLVAGVAAMQYWKRKKATAPQLE